MPPHPPPPPLLLSEQLPLSPCVCHLNHCRHCHRQGAERQVCTWWLASSCAHGTAARVSSWRRQGAGPLAVNRARSASWAKSPRCRSSTSALPRRTNVNAWRSSPCRPPRPAGACVACPAGQFQTRAGRAKAQAHMAVALPSQRARFTVPLARCAGRGRGCNRAHCCHQRRHVCLPPLPPPCTAGGQACAQ